MDTMEFDDFSYDDCSFDEMPIENPKTIKLEAEEESAAGSSWIKVKTPGQLNRSFDDNIKNLGILPANKIVNNPASTRDGLTIKRVGSTTITSLSTISPNIQKPTTQKFTEYQDPRESTMYFKIPPQQQQQQPTQQNGSRNGVDVRDHIIVQLQAQNRELKKAMMEFRADAADMSLKIKKWDFRISMMLNKFQTIKSPETRTKIKYTARKRTSPHFSTPDVPLLKQTFPSTRFHENSSTTTVVQKIVADPSVKTVKPVPEAAEEENGNGSGGKAVYRSPVFPISSLQILQQFESNLHQVQYFAYSKRNIFSSLQNAEIERPSVMLDFILKSMIHDDLMQKFRYNENENLTEDSFEDFPLVLKLFKSVVDIISLKKFGKRVDPNSITKFIRNKTIKNTSAPLNPQSAKVATNTIMMKNVQETKTAEPKRLMKVDNKMILSKIESIGKVSIAATSKRTKTQQKIKIPSEEPKNNGNDDSVVYANIQDDEDSDEELFHLNDD